MLDSIVVANLPDGADAYLGYVGGQWPTFKALKARFGQTAYLLSMAVAADENAEACDREPGDLDTDQVAAWTRRQLRRGVWRPVCYASASNMAAVLASLTRAGIRRGDVRLLSAHYGVGKHICGPHTCKYPGVPACDGTQWRDNAPGRGKSLVDESVLRDDFFEGDNMPISNADAAKIAKAVWTADGLIPGPDKNPANPFWEPQRAMADLGTQVRAIEAAVGAVAKNAGVDTPAVVAGILAGLDPVTLADAITTTLGPDGGQQVVTALQARLAAPSA